MTGIHCGRKAAIDIVQVMRTTTGGESIACGLMPLAPAVTVVRGSRWLLCAVGWESEETEDTEKAVSVTENL